MLHTRHFYYYRLFNINKLGSRALANWRSSTTTFDDKYSKIQNGNGCQLRRNIPTEHLKFCQSNQFCTGNDHFHSSEEDGTNSSSSTPLPITNTKQNEGQVMDSQYLQLNNKKNLRLRLEKGKSDKKFFEISFKKDGQFINFPNIPVPEDGYAFVRAMDELIEELAGEHPHMKMLKLLTRAQQSPVESTDDSRLPKNALKVRSVELIGLFHKFQLELLFFPNTHVKDGQNQMCIRLCALNLERNDVHDGRYMFLPLRALPWLRAQMAQMLMRYDGTEALDEAPKIPEEYLKLLMNNNDRSASNFVYPRKNAEHNGIMRPQFANKMPGSIQPKTSETTSIHQSKENQKFTTESSGAQQMLKELILEMGKEIGELRTENGELKNENGKLKGEMIGNGQKMEELKKAMDALLKANL